MDSIVNYLWCVKGITMFFYAKIQITLSTPRWSAFLLPLTPQKMTIIQFPKLYHGKQPVSSKLYNLSKKEEKFSIPENLRIDPNNNELSLEANGVLSKMLNRYFSLG